MAAIQLAAAARCHVTTTCGGLSIDRVREAGAEQVVDYTAEVMIYYFRPIPPAN